MNQMFATSECKVSRTWVLLLLTLGLLLLPACGHQSTAQMTTTSSPTTDQGSSSVVTQTPHTPTFSYLTNASASVSGLQIDAADVGCGGYVVLANPAQSVYDAPTANQMSQYVVSFYNSNALGGDNLLQDDPSIPAGLQLLPGGAMCSGGLTVTNMSQHAITITHATFTVTSTPFRNPLRYPLVDVCSLDYTPCNPGANGHGGCAYIAQAHFTGAESQSQTVLGPLAADGSDSNSDPSCAANLTLNPGDTNYINLNAVSDVPDVFAVQLGLVAQMGTGSAQPIVLPTAFTSEFVFASKAMFTCYKLANGHTAQETPVLSDDLLPPGNPELNGYDGPACI